MLMDLSVLHASSPPFPGQRQRLGSSKCHPVLVCGSESFGTLRGWLLSRETGGRDAEIWGCSHRRGYSQLPWTSVGGGASRTGIAPRAEWGDPSLGPTVGASPAYNLSHSTWGIKGRERHLGLGESQVAQMPPETRWA